MPDKKQLIVKIFGTECPYDESRTYRDSLDDWKDNHLTTLADFVDGLSEYNGDDIRDLYIALRRGQGDQGKRSDDALTILAWHSVARPFKTENKHFLDASVLMPEIERDAKSLYFFAALVLDTPSIGIYLKLLKLDNEFAQSYYAYAVQFYYANPGHESEQRALLVYTDDPDQD